MTSMKTPGSLARFFVCMAIAFMAALYLQAHWLKAR